MELKNLRNIFTISIIITNVVKAQYIFEGPSPKQYNDGKQPICFQIGSNNNDNARCRQFNGYYLPETDYYSDYSSFSSHVQDMVLNENIFNNKLGQLGCSSSSSSITNKEEMFCSYVLYDSISNNRCSENKAAVSSKGTPNYICRRKCLDYQNNLKNLCPENRYGDAGIDELNRICNNFDLCDGESLSTSNVQVSDTNKSTIPTSTLENLKSNISGNENSGIIVNNLGNSTNTDNNINTNNNNQNKVESNGNNNSNTIRTDSTNSDSGLYTNSKYENNGNQGLNKNILYTIGFMVPISLFVGIGFIYYRKKIVNKSYEFDRESYSYNLASNHSSAQNGSVHSMASNPNTHNNKVFSIGFTDPKNVPITIPIINKNIEEQDNMATNCVAELISTATMINAANNANNNIQPITPNEVNINVNTRYNTLNSYNSRNSHTSNTSNNSNSLQTNSLSGSRKLPSYVINKTQDSTSINANPATLKLNIPTQINPLSPTSPDSEASPIVELSITNENDPLLHIRKTNSFYHSSVSSESKKYNSFIAPISPIMSERSTENSYEHSHHSKEKTANDGKDERKSYTNHLLTQSILVDNGDDEDDEDNEDNEENEDDLESINDKGIELEEENTDLRPSKIFSADISNINNEGSSNIQYSNGISITIDDAEASRSSKYSSAKIPLSVMTVVQEFEPRMEDELALQINDRILLLKVFDDGWAVGLNQMTGKQGVFPMEYVVSSELIKSTNKFASQIEYRNVLPSRTQSQAFSNFSFSSTTINDSVIHLTDCDFDVTSFMSKSQSLSSSKYYTKNSTIENLRKSKLNNNSIIEN